MYLVEDLSGISISSCIKKIPYRTKKYIFDRLNSHFTNKILLQNRTFEKSFMNSNRIASVDFVYGVRFYCKNDFSYLIKSKLDEITINEEYNGRDRRFVSIEISNPIEDLIDQLIKMIKSQKAEETEDHQDIEPQIKNLLSGIGLTVQKDTFYNYNIPSITIYNHSGERYLDIEEYEFYHQMNRIFNRQEKIDPKSKAKNPKMKNVFDDTLYSIVKIEIVLSLIIKIYKLKNEIDQIMSKYNYSFSVSGSNVTLRWWEKDLSIEKNKEKRAYKFESILREIVEMKNRLKENDSILKKNMRKIIPYIF